VMFGFMRQCLRLGHDRRGHGSELLG
jgi:hypothetical protein